MRWKPHEKELLKQLYANTDIHTLVKTFNKSERSIYMQARILGIKKSAEYLEKFYKESGERVRLNVNTRFKKGQTAWNKGIPGSIPNNVTSFKKGNLPHNTRNEGDTRLDKEGYVLIKVAHRKWIRKHRLIWEQANGEIPKGYVLRIQDGNKENYDLENMQLITMAENMKLNHIHEYPTELKQTIKLLNKLKKKINEKQD